MSVVVLLDNGHGANTAGKCSPDGLFKEWQFSRKVVRDIHKELVAQGYDVRILVPEDSDISLAVRAARANEICAKYGKSNVLFISIHANAAPPVDGKWHNARGWCIYTSKGKTTSDKLASYIYNEAEKNFVGHTMRKDMSDGDTDWEANFAVLRNTYCPAVVSENFFQDNKEDVAYITSEVGHRAIVKTHVDGIINFIKDHYGKGEIKG